LERSPNLTQFASRDSTISTSDPTRKMMQHSLLIVEDEPDLLDLLTQWFTRSGYKVTGVSSAQQALKAIAPGKFQVALLDLRLPDMDGIELLQLLKSHHPTLEVVILSGWSYPPSQAKSEGAFACLEKPCTLSKLEAAIEEALELAVGLVPN
jgi:DNA-binding NtrC family response regulator